jgi:(1->4)-alpha-D-glucan 1-alpha-D-glucosylmutase
MNVPRATYRLQLRAGFGFSQAAVIAPYLARLGVSHVYLSPIFKARPDSVHGYDITDHNELNPELGTEADYASMIEAFRRQGLGRILDIVPNHMGVWGADNLLWLDVLEWGPQSQYAGWFDIDWSAQQGKLLAPVLGAQYGEELRGGKLRLKFESDGSFVIWAYEAHKLPICPLIYPLILGHQNPALDRLADLFLDLPQWRPQVAERARVLKNELAQLSNGNGGVRLALENRVERFNSDWRELDRLIGEQFWRVAFHRVAEDEINYRRFFNINDLAGLRVEVAPVFAHAHARIFRMLESGEIDGLRIDHIDGLFDPKAYLEALRAGAPRPFYLVVEKILASHESLRSDWPVEGTTGYDYANHSLGVLIDPESELAFTQTYHDFAAEDQDFTVIARNGKLRIMENEMASELNALGRRAAHLAGQSPMTADLTRALLQRAIRQVVASFPVYRTYLDFAGEPAEADRRDIAWAIARARRSDPDVHPSAFDFLQNALMAETEKPPTQELSHTAALRFAMKVQQFSGPVMAKGVEDTAFYRYNRFVALNEVGGAPERFGLSPAMFHKANTARAQNWPNAMLATATHDTKRGEDSRARLTVLAEMPDEWRRQVTTWSRILRARRGDVESKGPPDRDDEYMLYQMLVGSWPNDMLDAPSAELLEAYGARIHSALEKSLREAKRRSSWAAPDADYEQATQAFAQEALRSDTFLSQVLPFTRRVARLGVQNSLAQTVCKLTAPGVPDVYQGCELWDLNLVDPDNRRPVDFVLRNAAITDLAARLKVPEQRPALFELLVDEWQDGQVKLATTTLLLALRRDEPELFSGGDYQPIVIEGDRSDWAFGYVRVAGDRRLAVVIARYPAHREAEPEWGATARLPEGRWFDLFRGQDAIVGAPLHKWLHPLPFAVLLAR